MLSIISFLFQRLLQQGVPSWIYGNILFWRGPGGIGYQGERCWVNKSTVDAGLGHIIVGVKVGTVNVGEDSEGKVTSSYTCRCQVR